MILAIVNGFSFKVLLVPGLSSGDQGYIITWLTSQNIPSCICLVIAALIVVLDLDSDPRRSGLE